MNPLAASSAEPFPMVSITLLIDTHKALSFAVPKAAGLPDIKVTWFSAKVEKMVRPPEPSCLKRQHCSIPDSIPENDKFPKNHLFQFLFLTCLSLMGLDSFKSLDGCRCQDIILL